MAVPAPAAEKIGSVQLKAVRFELVRSLEE